MIRLGLIGYPLGHSLSPKIHNACLRACGLEGDYSLFPIAPDNTRDLRDLLARVRSGEITGLNVTIPHKQTVIQFMDELTPTAESIGAVNTIYLRGNVLVGDNTDAQGFLMDLKRFLAGGKSKIENPKSAIVLGAGGSARAVVHALLSDGWNVTIAARRIEQARELSRQFEAGNAMELGLQILRLSKCQLIVNTTPLGMTPNMDSSPLPEGIVIPGHVIVYDLVYNPCGTRLVRDAQSRGLPATTGLGMLIEQAALAFEIWTGFSPPRHIMYESVAG